MANAWLVPLLPIVGAAASSTALGDPSYVGNDYAGVVWQSGGEASPFLRLDLGADMSIDTVMLFGLKDAGAATVEIAVATSAQGTGFAAGSFTAFTAPAPALAGAQMPVSGRGTGLFARDGALTGRYVRIGFAGAGATLQVAKAVIGKRIQLERNFSLGAAFGVRDLGSLDFTRRGVLDRTRGKKLRTVGLTFSNIRKSEVEATTKPLLEQIGNTELVALVTDPTADAQRQNRCYLGPLVGDLSHAWRKADLFEAKTNVVSIF